MAIATCVFTCRSWFCMSRMTCLIIFSGSSALSTRSLMLARINVETLSSNAMTQTPFAFLQILSRMIPLTRNSGDHSTGGTLALASGHYRAQRRADCGPDREMAVQQSDDDTTQQHRDECSLPSVHNVLLCASLQGHSPRRMFLPVFNA